MDGPINALLACAFNFDASSLSTAETSFVSRLSVERDGDGIDEGGVDGNGEEGTDDEASLMVRDQLKARSKDDLESKDLC